MTTQLLSHNSHVHHASSSSSSSALAQELLPPLARNVAVPVNAFRLHLPVPSPLPRLKGRRGLWYRRNRWRREHFGWEDRWRRQLRRPRRDPHRRHRRGRESRERPQADAQGKHFCRRAGMGSPILVRFLPSEVDVAAVIFPPLFLFLTFDPLENSTSRRKKQRPASPRPPGLLLLPLQRPPPAPPPTAPPTTGAPRSPRAAISSATRPPSAAPPTARTTPSSGARSRCPPASGTVPSASPLALGP